jgi:hypothetical protein
MEAIKADLTEFQSLKDLKTMLSSPGPCASLYMTLAATPPSQSVRANALEWKELIRTVTPRLQQLGAEGRQLLETISDWDTVSQGQPPPGRAIAVFRSPHAFCVAWVEEPVRNRAFVGPHFYIRPLLPELTRAKTFYILALSQNNVRLLRCTWHSSDEVTFPGGVAVSFDAFMNMAKPDHTAIDRATAGPSAGHTKGVGGTLMTTREDKPEYLAHFFRQIDRGVNEVLRGSSDPLVIAAVDRELALYRSVNTYANLAEEDVQGAPNGLKAGEMHARAIDALLRSYEKKVDDVLSEYNHKVGSGASNRLKDIVTAAHDGRVLTLLVSDSLEATGAFDEATHSVKGRQTGASEDEDLVNDAAVQTILHSGQVCVARNSKLPNGAPLAAVFRY